MSLRLDDVEFEYVEFNLPEPEDTIARCLAAKAGVSPGLYLISLLCQWDARWEGELQGDYRYRPPD